MEQVVELGSRELPGAGVGRSVGNPGSFAPIWKMI